MLEERARASGLTLSEWVREVLLAAPTEAGAELVGEILLSELLALRALFLNVSFRNGKEPLTEPELRELIGRADVVKGERARERIEAARKVVNAERKEADESQTKEV